MKKEEGKEGMKEKRRDESGRVVLSATAIHSAD